MRRVSLLASSSILIFGLASCALYDGNDPGDGDDTTDPDPDPDVIAACGQPVVCPAPTEPNRVTVCGTIHDLGTDLAVGADAVACDAVTEQGACSLRVTLHDALDFAANPTTVQDFDYASLTIDGCGRFVAHDVRRPGLGFLAIAVDDASGAPDAHRPAWVAIPVGPAATVTGVRAYALRAETDEAWSAAAGVGSFADMGATVLRFVHGAAPAGGVVATRAGEPRPDDTFYFDDSGASRLDLSLARTATGANGSAVMVRGALMEHSGAGGEPAGCAWEAALAAAVPGAVFVGERAAIDGGGGLCN